MIYNELFYPFYTRNLRHILKVLERRKTNENVIPIELGIPEDFCRDNKKKVEQNKMRGKGEFIFPRKIQSGKDQGEKSARNEREKIYAYL